MKKDWFLYKAKKVGYVYYPVSWEGWLGLISMVGLIFFAAYIDNLFSCTITPREGLRFLLDIILIAGLAMLLFIQKTKVELKKK